MQISLFRGNRTVMSLRLCSRAPWTTSSSAAIRMTVYRANRRSSGRMGALSGPLIRSGSKRLLASVDVLDAVALVLELRAVGPRQAHPPVLLARVGVRRRLDGEGLDLHGRLEARPTAGIEPEDVGAARAAVAVAAAVVGVQ